MFKHSASFVVLALFAVSGCSSESLDATKEVATGGSQITQSPSNSPTAPEPDASQSATAETGYVLEEASVKAALKVAPEKRSMWQRTLIHASCLKEQGINAILDPAHPDRLRFTNVGEDKQDMMVQAQNACHEKYQLGAKRVVTREDAIKEYQHRVETKACFAENQVTVSDPPSQNAFVAKYLRSERTTEDLGVWDPWDQLPDSANPEALAKKCPRYRAGA